MFATIRSRQGGKTRAFTLIEFIVAASLTLLVLSMAVQSLTSSQRLLRTTSDQELMTNAGQSVLEKARAYTCGPQLAPDETQSARCAELLASSGAPIAQLLSASTTGDYVAATQLTQGYRATSATQASGAGCGFASKNSSTDGARNLCMTVLTASSYVKNDGSITDACGSTPKDALTGQPGYDLRVLRREATVLYTDDQGASHEQTIVSLSTQSSKKDLTATNRDGSAVIDLNALRKKDTRIVLTLKDAAGRTLVRVLPKSCMNSKVAEYRFWGLDTTVSYTLTPYYIDAFGISTTGTPQPLKPLKIGV